MRVRRVAVKIYKNVDSTKEIYTFRYPEANIAFKINQIDSKRPDACIVKIEGVDKKTYSIFKLPEAKDYNDKYVLEIYHGFDSNLNLVYTGTISRVIYSFNGGKQVLSMVADKNMTKFTKNVLAISLSGENTLLSALKHIATKFGYSLSVSDKVNTQETIKRFAITGSCENCLDALINTKHKYSVDDKNIKVYDSISDNKFISYTEGASSPIESKKRSEYTAHVNNGLISYPSDDTEDDKYNIKTILLPEIKTGDVIKIPVDKYWYSDFDTGNYRNFIVNKFNSVFLNGLGTTEMECGLDDK